MQSTLNTLRLRWKDGVERSGYEVLPELQKETYNHDAYTQIPSFFAVLVLDALKEYDYLVPVWWMFHSHSLYTCA